MFFHVKGSQPLCFIDEGSLLILSQQLPLCSQSLTDLRVMHLGILLSHLPSLSSRPNHESIHGSLHVVFSWTHGMPKTIHCHAVVVAADVAVEKSCCSQLRRQRCVEKKSEPEEDSSWSDQTCVGREASAASVTSTASENKTGRSTREVVQDPPLTPPPTPVIGLKDKKCKTVWETKSKKRTVHSWRGIEVRKTRRKEKHLLFILLQETVLTKERKRHE